MLNYKFNLGDKMQKIVEQAIQKLVGMGVPISNSIYFSTNGGFSYYGRTHFGKKIKEGVNLGTKDTFADIGATILEWFDLPTDKIFGTSFLEEIKNAW